MENIYGRGTQLLFRAESRNMDGTLTDSDPVPRLWLGRESFDMVHESTGTYSAIISTTGQKSGQVCWKIKTVTDIVTIRGGHIYFI